MKIFSNIILVTLMLLISNCNNCKNKKYDDTPAIPISLGIKISDSFSFAERDTLLLKKQRGKLDFTTNEWVNYYENDTFFLDNDNTYYQTINGFKNQTFPVINDSKNNICDTTLIVFDKYQYELIGFENIVEKYGKCENDISLKEKNIWINNHKMNVLENGSPTPFFKIHNNQLTIIK